MPYHAYRTKSGFRIVHESWKEGERQRRSIPPAEWPGLGLSGTMSLEQAREALKHPNRLEAEERGRQRALKRVEEDASADYIYLPPVLVAEFERELFVNSDRNYKPAHWEAAKRVIRHVGVPPRDWKFKRKEFYQWMRADGRRYSPDYVTDILRMVNMWGEYFCYRTNSFWAPVPSPDGPEMVLIRRAYYRKTQGGRDSARLSLAALQAKNPPWGPPEIPEANYNWLLVSVVFGLRPEEIDRALSDRQYRRFGPDYLRVFQFKLERLGYPDNLCWKKIDAWMPIQQETLARLKAGMSLKRPGRKMLKKWFGKRVGYYAGRKEFAPWMRSLGNDAYKVMRWMGHQDLQTLRRNYDKADTDAPSAEDDEAA